MPDPAYLIGVVAVSAAVTWALRALPFTVLGPLRASSAVACLSERMPLGVLVILLGYTLPNLPVGHPVQAVPAMAALAATAGLQLWRRNAVLSVLAGTALHVVLASALASH